MSYRTKFTSIICLGFCCLLTACRGEIPFKRPNGVAQAADGSLFVLDFGNHRIVHLSTNNKILGTFGRFGLGAEDIYHAYDLAIGPDNNIYFCNFLDNDQGVFHDGIKVFSASGRFLRELGSNDYRKDSTDPTYLPYGLDIDSFGRIYTADYGMSTVRVFTPEGQSLAQLALSNDRGEPLRGLDDVAVDERRNLLYATDFDLSEIHQYRLSFDASGVPTISYLKTLALYGRDAGQVAFPQYLAVNDQTGMVYVGDMANRRIQVFDSEGNYVTDFAPPGVNDWESMGINIGADNTILIADAFNNTIWIFSPDGFYRNRIEIQP